MELVLISVIDGRIGETGYFEVADSMVQANVVESEGDVLRGCIGISEKNIPLK